MLALVNSAPSLLGLFAYPCKQLKKLNSNDITNTDILGD